MSAGNLYRYFSSKEALIAGICERNRADAVESFSLVEGAPDFFDALAGLARHHLINRTDDEVSLCAEIMAESRRHPEIAKLYQTIENDIRNRIATMLKGAAARGEVRGDIDMDAAASVLMALGDGMSWRRSVDPAFDPEAALPMILKMVHCLLAKPDAAATDAGAKP